MFRTVSKLGSIFMWVVSIMHNIIIEVKVRILIPRIVGHETISDVPEVYIEAMKLEFIHSIQLHIVLSSVHA